MLLFILHQQILIGAYIRYVEPYVDILRLSTSQLRARSYLQANAPLGSGNLFGLTLKV